MLRRGSKLLAMANEDNYAVAIYHGTPVVYWDKINDDIQFSDNNYKTMSTASAMTIALQDNCGLDNIRVRCSKKMGELYLVNTITNYEETLNTYDTYTFNSLINFGE